MPPFRKKEHHGKVVYEKLLEGFGSQRGRNVTVTAENGCVMVIDHNGDIAVALRAHEWAPFMRAMVEAMEASKGDVDGVDGVHADIMQEVRRAASLHEPLLSSAALSGDGVLVDDWDFDPATADQKRRELAEEAARQKADQDRKQKLAEEVDSHVPT